MAGPCAVESREQLLATARWVKREGATILRGGAFKPRTSPYAFQGLGIDALKLLAEAREETGLPDRDRGHRPRATSQLFERVRRHAPGRRPQHAELRAAQGGRPEPQAPSCSSAASRRPSRSGCMAAEYILSSGNPNVILCERGIRTFETATRNTLDLSAVPVLRERTHLPVMVDPSHGTGHRSLVRPHGGRRGRGRCRWHHHRGPPRPARRTVRLRAVALVPRVRRPHGRPAPPRVPAPANGPGARPGRTGRPAVASGLEVCANASTTSTRARGARRGAAALAVAVQRQRDRTTTATTSSASASSSSARRTGRRRP